MNGSAAVAVREQESLDNIISDVFRAVGEHLQSEPMTLAAFIRGAWPIIDPSSQLIDSWYIDCIAEHLQAVDAGHIQKLNINMPPRYGKSNIVTIAWPAWSWTQRPWLRWIFSSYAQSLATRHSLARRRIIDSDWYLERFGNVFAIQSDQNQKTEIENTVRGAMTTTSVGGSITGSGGHRIVMDDLIDPLDADSKAARKHAIDHYRLVLSTRIDDKKAGAFVHVAQRLHNEDVSGHLLKEGGWVNLNLPARAEDKHVIVFPMTKRKITREVGDLLCPEREGEKELTEAKAKLGSRGFNAQYQQKPTSETGNVWMRHWWKFYRQSELPARFDAIIQSWDMNFQKTTDGSFVVGQVWGLLGARKYLLDQTRARMSYVETKKAMTNLSAKWPLALAKLVENKANGPAIISDLCATIPGLIPVNPEGNKVVRASAVSATIEAGDVYIPVPEELPWVNDFIEESAAFPDYPTDDQVDTASQALTKLNAICTVPKDTGTDEVAGSFIDGEGMQEFEEVSV